MILCFAHTMLLFFIDEGRGGNWYDLFNWPQYCIREVNANLWVQMKTLSPNSLLFIYMQDNIKIPSNLPEIKWDKLIVLRWVEFIVFWPYFCFRLQINNRPMKTISDLFLSYLVSIIDLQPEAEIWSEYYEFNSS